MRDDAMTARDAFGIRHGWLGRLALAALVLGVGLAIAFLPLPYAVAALLGSIALVSILIRPLWGIYLLAFAVPFGSLREFPLGGINVGAVEVLTGLTIAVWIAQMVAARRVHVSAPPLVLPLFAFLGALLLSTLAATSLPLSVKEIVKWLEILAIYLFLAHCGDERAVRILLFCLLLAGSAEALLGIYQFLFRRGPEGFLLMGRFMRAYGTFRQPNPYAGYLGLHLPLAFGILVAEGQALWRGWRRGHWGQLALAWLALISFALMFAALIMSWSRGGWLGFGVATAAMALMASRRMRAASIGVGLALALFLMMGGIALIPSALWQRVAEALPYATHIDLASVEVTDENWALVERMAHWQAAWRMFADKPWLGVGIGNYAVAYPDYALPRWQDPLGHAHNYHLNIAAEAGLVGLLAYIALWAACFCRTSRILKRARGFGRGLAIAVLGILVHLTVHNTFDNLYVQGMNLQVGFALGLLYWAERTATYPQIDLAVEM